MADAAPNDSPSQGAAAPPAESQTPAEPVDPRKRLAAWYLLCGHRALWRLPLIPAVALLVGFLMLRGTFSDPQANLAESQRLIDEIKPAPVPDAENAALVYRKAFAAGVNFQASAILRPEEVAGPDTVLLGHPVVQSYFLANASARKLFFDASRMEKCNWNLKLNDTSANAFWLHTGMRWGAYLLAAHARWLAHCGDHAGAAAEIAAIYRMAHHVGTDRLLAASRIELEMVGIADAAIQQIALWDTPTTLEELSRYRQLVMAPRRPDERYVYIMQGERAWMLHKFDLMAVGDANAACLVVDADDIKYAMIVLSADRECYKHATQVFLDRVGEGQVPTTQQELASEFRSIAREAQAGPGQETGQAVEEVVGALISFRRSADSGRVTAAGLAFLAYRIKYGKDPASLDELVPEYLPEVPVGASDGKPLRMRKDNGGMNFEYLEDRLLLSDRLDKFAKLASPTKLEDGPALGAKNGCCKGLVRIYALGENGEDNDGFATGVLTGEQVSYVYWAIDPDRPADDTSFAVPPSAEAENAPPEALRE